jgi:DNA-binding PadR family transcriptional regulator
MPDDDALSPQPVLLGLLVSEPKHGYELYQELSRELGRVWQLGLSKLYAQLKQLEEVGLVTQQIEPQPNRPARKVYHLAAEGRAVFVAWLQQPTPYLRDLRVELLGRSYFSRRLSLPGADSQRSLPASMLLARVPYLGPLQMPGQADHQVALAVLRAIGLAHLQDRPLPTLSGGERQLAILACALAQEPRILLMDEPTAQADLNHQARLPEIMRSLVAQGATQTRHPAIGCICLPKGPFAGYNSF